MSVRLTILCENTVGRANGAIGEHGFSCFVETDAGNYLFDTGNGAGLLHNASVLGVDLTSVRAIILSHGHFDHCGGLKAALAGMSAVEVVAHPGIFRPRYWQGQYEKRANGLPFRRTELEAAGARFSLTRGFLTLAPGLHYSGEIPRVTPFETGDPHLVIADENGVFSPDPFDDDAFVAVETGQGLVLLLGCAHAGVVNSLHHAAARTGLPIHAVVGGTHLAPAGEAQFAETVAALREFRVAKLAVSHCTGLPRAAQLNSEFPGRFAFASVGTVLEF
jgi:7,8-dihydropterin-6-yl-methyl-4-(beta-D-ribofuranosyl)aminobenzene 5'-phosphate synthase